jgi:hypothetical protein
VALDLNQVNEEGMKGSEKVFLLGGESIGRGDDDLGYEILVNLLKSLASREDRPAAIICWNTAVRLLAEGSPVVPSLKALEARGVPILAGQLCVTELELTGKLSAGKPATIDEILDLLLHHEVINL